MGHDVTDTFVARSGLPHDVTSLAVRSSLDGLKKIKKIKGFGYRSFSVLAPLVWNNLPAHIPHCSSLSQFRTSLITFLFTSAVSELL